MHTHILRLLAPALSLLLSVSPIALGDEAADRAALEAATQVWINAFNARDADAMIALTTEDVVLLDPAVPRSAAGRRHARPGDRRWAPPKVKSRVRPRRP